MPTDKQRFEASWKMRAKHPDTLAMVSYEGKTVSLANAIQAIIKSAIRG